MRYLLLFVLIVTLYAGCKKDKDNVNDNSSVCDIKGTYFGTAVASTGGSTTEAYEFRANNFAVGTVTLGGPGVTFGGYRNTCDSVIISSHYAANGDYYLLLGKFSSNRTILSGTYQDITSGVHGTFTLTKQ